MPPMDAGPPWSGETSGYPCYPVEVFNFFGGGTTRWTQGEPVICDDYFGFRADDPADRAAAEVYLGAPCEDIGPAIVCEVFGSHVGPPTEAQYARICEVHAALGPRDWVCAQGE